MRNFEALRLTLISTAILCLLIDLQTEMHNFSIGFVSICSCAAFIYLGKKSKKYVTHINKSSWFKGVASLVLFIILSGTATLYYFIEPFKIINTGKYVYYSGIFGIFFLAPFVFSLYLSFIVLSKYVEQKVK